MRYITLLVLAFLFSVEMGQQSRADDFDFRMAIQLRLIQDGFYKGRPDARIGPMTRKAMAAFAEEHGVSSELKSVTEKMVELAFSERIEMPEKLKERAVTKIKNSIKDPYSAEVKVSYAYFTPLGNIAVCGEVNAKNSYGAFVGFQWFQVLVQPLFPDESSRSTRFQDDGALEMCLFGTSAMALIRLD